MTLEAQARRVAAQYLSQQDRTAKVNYAPSAAQALAAYEEGNFEPGLAFLNKVLKDLGAPPVTWDGKMTYPRLQDLEWYQALGPRLRSRAEDALISLRLAQQALSLSRTKMQAPHLLNVMNTMNLGRIPDFAKHLKEVVWLGTIMVNEENENETIKQGPFTVIPIKGITKADLAKCLEALDKAIQAIRPRFPQVLYGKLYITKTLPKGRGVFSNILAHYVSTSDVMAMTMKAHGHDAVQTLIHELAHRYWHKYMTSALASQWEDVSYGNPVTPYGGTSSIENFAEGFSYYLMGKDLPHPAMKDFFSRLS